MGSHVIVLAAGRGSRLGALGSETPKWLLDLGGRALAERHLEAFARSDGAVASVLVVTGHATEAVERFVAERPEAGAKIVHNPEYASRNNWYSLLLALRSITEADARVVVLNGDLFVDTAAIAGFLADSMTAPAEGLLAVDLERPLTPESMKVAMAADGALERIGKVGVEHPAGEYVGMLMARGSVLAALRQALEDFVGRADAADQWYEAAVQSTVRAGARWAAWPMPSSRWVEIDDDRDLAAALELLPS